VRVTKGRLLKIIKEELRASKLLESPGASQTEKMLSRRADMILEYIRAGYLRRAASVVMDSLWIDDVFPEDVQALMSALEGVQTEEKLYAASDAWLAQFRSGGFGGSN